MAVDLVLRLCQVPEEQGGLPGADELPGNPGYIPGNSHIALNDFTDGLFDILSGVHSVQQFKTFYDMPANQQAQFDSLLNELTADDPTTAAAPPLALQLLRIHRFRAVLTKWERRSDLNLTAYDTPDDVQTWLTSISEIGS